MFVFKRLYKWNYTVCALFKIGFLLEQSLGLLQVTVWISSLFLFGADGSHGRVDHSLISHLPKYIFILSSLEAIQMQLYPDIHT